MFYFLLTICINHILLSHALWDQFRIRVIIPSDSRAIVIRHQPGQRRKLSPPIAFMGSSSKGSFGNLSEIKPNRPLFSCQVFFLWHFNEILLRFNEVQRH